MTYLFKKGISKNGIPFLIALLFTNNCFADFSCDINYQNAHSELLELDYKSADVFIKLGKKINAENKLYVLLDSYTQFLKCVTADDNNSYLNFKQYKKVNLSAVADDTSSSIWKTYSLAEIHLQYAFCEAKFGSYLDAVSDINKAYDYLLKIKNRNPEFIPAKKCLGLLLALIGNVPDDYKWATNALGLKGDVTIGLKILGEAYLATQQKKEWNYIEAETLFYYAFATLNLSSNETELEKTYSSVKQKASTNPLLCYAASSIALKSGKNNDALFFLNCDEAKTHYTQFPYLIYLNGLAHLNKLDTTATSLFKNYLSAYKGQNYIKAAYRNIAWCYKVNNANELYAETMQEVLKHGSAKTDEDKQAEKDAKSTNVINIQLLKARLLFDGGYYSKALNALIEKPPANNLKTHKDLMEFEYRLARIYHKMNLTNKAIELYQYVYTSCKNYPYYFAANAALNLGLIHEQEKNFEKAAYYYQLAIELKNYEYKNSIQLKAKAGLSRVQKK
jgi:hypothetical protein